MKLQYKEIVKQIASLPWEKANSEDLIFLARGTAIEFAESLRKASALYPNDTRLKEMIGGELDTDNLQFEEYKQRGDHWQYLDYFIKKHSIEPSNIKIEKAIDTYLYAVEKDFTDEERAMTVFSREEELTSIFEEITSKVDWNTLGYSFYKNYLDSHIEFDSGDAGHHYLTEHYLLAEKTLEKFYEIRLKMYQSLFI